VLNFPNLLEVLQDANLVIIITMDNLDTYLHHILWPEVAIACGNYSNSLQQVLSVLDPAHKRSLDIASYFCESGGRDLVDDNDGVLPEVPLAGLRQRGGRKGGRGKGARSKCVDLLCGAKYFVHIVRC